MSELSVKPQSQETVAQASTGKHQQDRKPAWETPKLEDVSEQVMAQPYIRFT
ncbi:MAG TPA: hypothetical protein VGI14_04170 [Casimicrobiaceae bacterium]|jgi:hypothetical protein